MSFEVNCVEGFYRKEKGLEPTGILSHRAKASGLSSVSELLQVEGDDSFAYAKKVKLVTREHFDLSFVCVTLMMLIDYIISAGGCFH